VPWAVCVRHDHGLGVLARAALAKAPPWRTTPAATTSAPLSPSPKSKTAPAADDDQVAFTATTMGTVTSVTQLPGGLTQVTFSNTGTGRERRMLVPWEAPLYQPWKVAWQTLCCEWLQAARAWPLSPLQCWAMRVLMQSPTLENGVLMVRLTGTLPQVSE
jgi:hypothetical protein